MQPHFFRLIPLLRGWLSVGSFASIGEITRCAALLMGCLVSAGTVVAAERSSSPSFMEQIVGRWESSSFVITNCIIATNLSYVALAANISSNTMGGELQYVWSFPSLV